MACKGYRTSKNKWHRNRKMNRSLTIRVNGYKRAGKKVKPHTRKIIKH